MQRLKIYAVIFDNYYLEPELKLFLDKQKAADWAKSEAIKRRGFYKDCRGMYVLNRLNIPEVQEHEVK